MQNGKVTSVLALFCVCPSSLQNASFQKIKNQQLLFFILLSFLAQQFREVLSSFRIRVQEEIQRNVLSRSFAAFTTQLLPLTTSGERALQHSLLQTEEGSICRPSQQSCFLHEKAFAMSHDFHFCFHERLNTTFHIAIILFNLGLLFHLLGKQTMSLNQSSCPPRPLLQARALYAQSLQLLQESLNATPQWAQSTYRCPRTTGNALVDHLLLALLNNTAVLCCIDLCPNQSCHIPTKDHLLDARDLTFVGYFATFVDVVKKHHCTSAASWQLQFYSLNAVRLNKLFFQGSAAGSA